MKFIKYWLKKVMYILRYGSSSKEHINFVMTNGRYDEKFIDKYLYLINRHILTEYIKLDYKLIDKYKNNLDWDRMSLRQDIDEEFIDKYSQYLNWWFILTNQMLSEEFITKHIGKT